MKTGYKVYDAMTRNPVYVHDDVSIKECAEIMAKEHVGSLLVKDKQDKLKGVITEQDIVRKFVIKSPDANKEKVSEFMEQKLITVNPEVDIYDALIVMREENIRHLPVMTDNEMVGFLTMKDILKIQPSLFDILVDKFELRETETKPAFTKGEGICQMCGKYVKKLHSVGNSTLCESCKKIEKK